MRRLVLCVVAALLVAAVPAGADADACADERDPAYTSHPCKVERLRARSFAVVAVVDSGINPYHVDFRLPPDDDLVGVHPSEFIEGYPADAERMQPSFDAPDVASARSLDATQWERAAGGQLTWVDGTSIVGAVSAHPGEDFFDVIGHGTPAASQAAGRVLGPAHPDVLLVVVKGWPSGVEWAARQPWIDAINLSWSSFAADDRTAAATWSAADSGKIICAATGNVTVPLWLFQQQGPSWHVHVGAVHADDDGPGPTYSGATADVLGITNVPAATHDSMEGSAPFAGTSGASPAACGLITQTIADARQRLGDTTEGPRGDGVLAAGAPTAGPAADGVLTRTELTDAVFATARPRNHAPPADVVRDGYGVVSGESAAHAVAVLFGDAERPDRSTEDAWHTAATVARNALWGQPPPST